MFTRLRKVDRPLRERDTDLKTYDLSLLSPEVQGKEIVGSIKEFRSKNIGVDDG